MGSRRLLCLFLALGATSFSFAAAPPAERAKTEGFAIVRIAHNRGVTFSDVEVEQTSDKPRGRRLSFDAGDGENPVIYAGWLEPGEYRFSRLMTTGAQYNGAFVGSMDLHELELATFRIEAGKMVDLGTLLLQPIGGDRATLVPWDGEHAYDEIGRHEDLTEAAPAFPDPPVRWNGMDGWSYHDVLLVGGQAGPGTAGLVGELVHAAIEEAATKDSKPALTQQWSEAASPTAFIEISKKATLAMGQPEFDDAGNAYFRSALGQILRRTPAGEWTNLDTGVTDTLSALLIDGRNIYASTFQHRLLASADGGATWTSAQVPVEPSVAAIARLPGGDFIAVTEVPPKGRVALVLRGPDFLALPAQPWKELKADRGWTQGPKDPFSPAIAAATPDVQVVWTGDHLLNLYDAANDRWTLVMAPGAIRDLYANRSAGLVYYSGAAISAGSAMVGIRLNNGAVSEDGGKTWQPLELDRHAGLGFRDRMNGIAIIADFHGFRPELFTATTLDGGKTWNRFETKISGFCALSAYLPTGELLCMRNDGDIQSTRTGEQWVIERAVL